MKKDTAFFSFGSEQQENMHVNSKCTLMLDPDAHIWGKPRISGMLYSPCFWHNSKRRQEAPPGQLL